MVYDGIMPADRIFIWEKQDYGKEGHINIACVAGFYDRYKKARSIACRFINTLLKMKKRDIFISSVMD